MRDRGEGTVSLHIVVFGFIDSGNVGEQAGGGLRCRVTIRISIQFASNTSLLVVLEVMTKCEDWHAVIGPRVHLTK